jgi:hypothetical protein
MNLIEFNGQNVVIAKDQPEYNPLPAYRIPGDAHGRLVCCWKLSWRERVRLLITGELWHTILTFNQQLQPQLIEVKRPEYIPYVEEANET